jgi:hypothetical protein
MADEEEKGFEVVDKRSQTAHETAEQPDPVDEPADETDFEDDDDYVDAGFTGAMPKLAVTDILRMTVNMLNEKAWIHMGLIPDPLSGQIDRELTEARLAIDALADLAKHLEPHTEGAEKRELQVMVSNLRINYVQQARQ